MQRKLTVKRWFSRSQVDGRRTALVSHAFYKGGVGSGVAFYRATRAEMSPSLGVLASRRYTVNCGTCYAYTNDFREALRAFVRALHDMKRQQESNNAQ